MGLQHIKAISKSKKANLHSIVDISNAAKNLSKKYKIPQSEKKIFPVLLG